MPASRSVSRSPLAPLSALALALVLLGAPAASAQEQLLMSGKHLSDYGQINIPVLITPNGTGFVTVQHGPLNTITVPAGFFVGGGQLLGGFTIPIAGNPDVQQLFTSWLGTAPAATMGDAVLRNGLTSQRPQTDFAWCPGMTVATCMDQRSSAGGAPPGSGTAHGLIRYRNDGEVYSGTMQMFLSGPAALSNKIGLTPRFQHTPLAVNGPQPFAAPYANNPGPGAGASAVVTTGAGLGGTTPSGGIIVTPGNFISAVPPGLGQAGFGMPLTIGSVYVKHTNSAGTETEQTGVGSKDTINGRGTITMVAGGVQSSISGASVAGFPSLVTVTMDIASSQRTPALSPAGLVGMAGAMLAAGGYLLRRRFARA